MKKTLVTGGGGFIASHLIERLAASGTALRAFVRYNSRNDYGNIEHLPVDIKNNIEIFSGDLKDGEAVRKAVSGCDTVFHLGALIAIPYSYINPLDFVQTNVLGTANVLNACLDLGVSKIVHISTSEVYGTAKYTPIDEKHPIQGQSPYSASKIGADKLAESYYRSFNLPVTTIRPFNTYGPRQSARAVIPTIITQALTGDKIVLGNLTPRRDLLYVKDTAAGMIKAAESADNLGLTINLGTGYDISIGELAQKIIQLIGRPISIEQDKKRIRPDNSEVMRLLADNSLAKRILGWQPAYSLDEGLAEYIAWIRGHLHLYKINQYNL